MARPASRKTFLLLLLFLGEFGRLAAAPAPMDLDRLPINQELPLRADFLADPSGALGWSQAWSRIEDFRPLKGTVQSFGFSPGALWFRAELVTRTVPHATLVAWGTLLNHVDVFFVDPTGKLIVDYRSGDAVVPDPRLPQSLAFQFLVPDRPSTTVLIRIQTAGSVVFQMYLWNPTALGRNLEFQNLLLGFVFGFLLLMTVVNLLFRFSLQDRRFLWYAAYVGSMAYMLMVYTGWIRFLVLPYRFPQDFWDVGSLGMLLAVAVWFCRHANRLSVLRGNLAFSVAVTVLAAAGVLLSTLGWKNLGLLVLNGTLVMLIFGCWGFVFVQAKRGDRFSRFFLAAWSLPLLSGLLISAQAVIASTWDGFNPYYLLVGGVLVETLILSFAFSDQVHQWHKSIQWKLRESYRQDRLAALGMVASQVGHEINTPNHVIALTLVSLERENRRLLTEPEPEKLEAWARESSTLLGSLTTASRQIATVTSQLMSDRGTGNPPGPCNLTEILEQVWRLHHLRWKSASSRWTWPLNQGAVRVWGSAQGLQQLIVNLVDNAVFALENPGQAIAVKVGTKEDKAYLVVEDEGRGMDEAKVRRLGQPFFTTRPGGHGLGWGICQQIAREHQAHLAIASTPGKGTSVTFTLPLTP